MIQLSNSSIIIEYANLSFIMYDHQFKYKSEFKGSVSTISEFFAVDSSSSLLMVV